VFGFDVPVSLPGVEASLLNPKSTWPDQTAYDETAKKLAQMYIDNFEKYKGKGSIDYTQFGPKV
jgi:phosphoenolpyruvate carboxykinase (ATP)